MCVKSEGPLWTIHKDNFMKIYICVRARVRLSMNLLCLFEFNSDQFLFLFLFFIIQISIFLRVYNIFYDSSCLVNRSTIYIHGDVSWNNTDFIV